MRDLGSIENIEVFPHQPGGSPATWFEDIEVESEEWLINRLVPRRSYTGMFGRRGSAKTFLALDMACHGALGLPFLGQETERFGSIYCVGEKKSRFGKRVEAWKQAHNCKGKALPLIFRWGVPNLLDEAEVADFIAELNLLRLEFERRGAPLKAVFLDTLSRSLRGANVSDPDAAGTAIGAIQRIIDECGVTVIPLAHVAKAEGALSLKGAGEWEDAADALIRIDRKGTESMRTVSLTKQSDEADGLEFAFELDVVEVVTRPKGRPVTSCVVRQVGAPDSGMNGRAPRLNAAATAVLLALGRLEEEGQLGPVPICPGIPPGTEGVRLADLRSKTYDLGLNKASEPASDSTLAEKSRWSETRKKAFQRAIDKLQEARKIRQEGEFVWRL